MRTVSPIRSSKSSALAARRRTWYSRNTRATTSSKGLRVVSASDAAWSGPMSSFLRFEMRLDSTRPVNFFTSRSMSRAIIDSRRRESSAS